MRNLRQDERQLPQGKPDPPQNELAFLTLLGGGLLKTFVLLLRSLIVCGSHSVLRFLDTQTRIARRGSPRARFRFCFVGVCYPPHCTAERGGQRNVEVKGMIGQSCRPDAFYTRSDAPPHANDSEMSALRSYVRLLHSTITCASGMKSQIYRDRRCW